MKKVKIIGNKASHHFEIGQIVYLGDKYEEDGFNGYYASSIHDVEANKDNTIYDCVWVVYEEDFDNIEKQMNELTDEQLWYLSDDMYLPIQYNNKVEQPAYLGDGIYSVDELQKICKQYKEYVHQQSIIKHNCMKHIVELKFGIKLI